MSYSERDTPENIGIAGTKRSSTWNLAPDFNPFCSN